MIEIRTDVIALKKRMVEKYLDRISDLSKASGINCTTLRSVVFGRSQPSSEVIKKLVNALDIRPEEVVEIFFNQNLRNM